MAELFPDAEWSHPLWPSSEPLSFALLLVVVVYVCIYISQASGSGSLPGLVPESVAYLSSGEVSASSLRRQRQPARRRHCHCKPHFFK